MTSLQDLQNAMRTAVIPLHNMGIKFKYKSGTLNIERLTILFANRSEVAGWQPKTRIRFLNEFENALKEITEIEKQMEEYKKKVGASMETKLNSLEAMNEMLQRFEMAPENSKTKAREALKKIKINIFDLEAGATTPTFKSLWELSNYTFNNGKVFPKNEAKNTPCSKCFSKALQFINTVKTNDNNFLYKYSYP